MFFFLSIFIKDFKNLYYLISLFSVEPISANKTLLVLSNPKLFYKCDVGSNFTADKVIFKYEQLKVQAFNVENEKFAENGNFFSAYSYFIRIFFLCLLFSLSVLAH